MTNDQFVERHGWVPPQGWSPGPQRKPAGCVGCPLEHDSKYYVPDEMYPGVKTLILMEHPSAEDERLGLPACGKTGDVLNTQFLPLANLQRGQVSVANVIRCRYGAHAPSKTDLGQAVEQCNAEYFHYPDTTYVIAQGELAFNYANTHFRQGSHPVPGTVSSWRGFELPDSSPTTFITVPTADTFRDPVMSWVSNLDWRHLGGYIIQGHSPTPPPQLRADGDMVQESTRALFRNADTKFLVIDTEFIPATGYLTVLGIGFQIQNTLPHTDGPLYKNPCEIQQAVLCREDTSFNILSIDWASTSAPVRAWYRSELKRLVGQVPVVFQNAMADLPILDKNMGITYGDFKQVEDTMLAHAILWCELPHTLDFLASLYGQYGKFKHLWGVDELRYNYGDVVDTHLAWQALEKGFVGDRQAESIYRTQSLALIPILLDAKKRGIRVNKARVLDAYNELQGLIRQVGTFATLATGYPINLNSGAQLKNYLYTERRLPIQISKDTKQPTTDDDAIAKLRSIVGPVYDTSKSLTYDRDDETHLSLLKRVADGADPILEARALWAGAWQVANNYLIGLAKGVYGEDNKAKRKNARTEAWKTGLTLDGIVNRIYPNFAIHAQKTGRWSTTDPPLAQLPADLRDIICSEADEICISWDWSAIEPRVLQALTGSTLLKKTFDENFDLHTWTVCYMFGYDMPPDLVDPHKSASCETWRVKYNWKGKDDPRRVFAKQGRYEMWYGGSGSNAAAAAAQFGLNPTALRVALTKLASSDPAYYAWKVRTEADVKKTAVVRTFMGRPRRFLSHGDSRRREGLDQPMQGAVSDIFNTTVVMLAAQHPYLRWGWGMHDSQKWYVKRSDLTPERFTMIRAIIERSHIIAGRETRFPGDFEILYPPEEGNRKLTPAQHFALAV